jgi:chemotaxis protein MotB
VALTEATDEGGGEGYFASVSDMMVGILFIFLLLLTVFALNFRDAEQEQKAKLEDLIKAEKRATVAEERANEEKLIAHREAALAEARKAENDQFRALLFDAVAQLEKDIRDREAARGQLLVSLQQSLSNKGVTVSIDPASGILRLPEDLLFKTGDAAIGKDNLPRLQTLAAVLASTLPCYVHGGDASGCNVIAPILETVLVEGHTDRQAYKNTIVPVATQAPTSGSLFSKPPPPPAKVVVVKDSELRNDRLSTDRALNVFKELRQAQPSLDALRNSDQQPLFGFSGYGPRRPLPDALGSSQAEFQKNRRIDLRFVLSARTSDELMRLREQIQEALGNGK